MKRFDYLLVGTKGTTLCSSLRSAEYLFSCRKTATIVKRDRSTGLDFIIAAKTDGVVSQINR
jgi:hypothetical protein